MPEEIITSLTTTLSASNFWSAITPMVPIIGGIVVFSFAFYILRRVMRKGSRGHTI